MTLDCEVVVTRDGTRAMRDRSSGEVMHPIIGPKLEAERLYVTAARLAQRLASAAPEPLVVLDVGLGAGSNAVAAWTLSEARSDAPRGLGIVSFDRSAQALELALRAEHAADFGFEGAAGAAALGLLSAGAVRGRHTHWQLRLGALPYSLESEAAASADVVFWDPFSPSANPELWTLQAFVALRRVCRAGATVHTYSGATSARSALLLAGFAVGLGEPVSAGRVATIAAVDASDLECPLDRRWFERLSRSSVPFPADAPGDALERIRALGQFQ